MNRSKRVSRQERYFLEFKALPKTQRGGLGTIKFLGYANTSHLWCRQNRIGPFSRFGEGIEPRLNPNELASVAFELSENAIGIADNNNSVSVVELIDIQPAKLDKKSEAWLSLERELISGMEQDYLEAIHSALRKKYSISINQDYIEKLVKPE